MTQKDVLVLYRMMVNGRASLLRGGYISREQWQTLGEAIDILKGASTLFKGDRAEQLGLL